MKKVEVGPDGKTVGLSIPAILVVEPAREHCRRSMGPVELMRSISRRIF